MTDFTFTAAEPYFDGSPRYDVLVEGRTVGSVRRDARHVYRTAYKGSRIGYDRRHSCWRPEPKDGRFLRVCAPTRGGAARWLLPMSI